LLGIKKYIAERWKEYSEIKYEGGTLWKIANVEEEINAEEEKEKIPDCMRGV